MHEGTVTISVEQGATFVARLFEGLGVAIRSVTVTRPSLDDVFLAHTGKTMRDAESNVTDANRAMMMAFRRK